jgi:RNA polymerase sigma factor (sigma-70 family)
MAVRSFDRMDDLSAAAAPAARGRLSLVRSASDDTAVSPLLPDVAAGSERAVQACVARYGALVWSLARRWSPDQADAEDATQEIFIDLWRSASKYDPSRLTEAGWVAMIARRRLIDRSRRRERLPSFEPLAEEHDAVDERAYDVEHAARVEQARAVLRELPATQRRMLELSLLEGRSHDEIARETSTPLGTVKSHIRRGLQRARDLLASREPANEQGHA